MSLLAAQQLGIAENDIVVASTGVIGQPLEIKPICDGLPALVAGLVDHGSDAAVEGNLGRKNLALDS